ncbi:hypothetical protein DPMN_024043 [Dreissena polymorpha]|uniref:Uncharacterized protein n=1 Tax=Dreissena polymorpha TaxID=45954 RepID=A0A9D4LN63_DREPO|nr:hypothetical protein DPMN_024043 [Dreissena polymorpha]
MGQGVQNGQKNGMDNRGYQGTDPYYRDNYHAPSDPYSRAGPPSHYEQPYAHKDPYGMERPPMYDQAMSGGGRRQY